MLVGDSQATARLSGRLFFSCGPASRPGGSTTSRVQARATGRDKIGYAVNYDSGKEPWNRENSPRLDFVYGAIQRQYAGVMALRRRTNRRP